MRFTLSQGKAKAVIWLLLLSLLLLSVQVPSQPPSWAQGGDPDGGEAGYAEQPGDAAVQEGEDGGSPQGGVLAEDPWLAEESLAVRHDEALSQAPGAAAPALTPNAGSLAYYDEQTGQWVSDDSVTTYPADASRPETLEEQQYYQQKLEGIDPIKLIFRSGVSIQPEPGIAPGVLERLTTPAPASEAGDEPYVLQFRYPFPTEARHRLEAAEVTVHDTVGPNALYASIPPGALNELQALLAEGLVRYVGDIPPSAKVDPALIAQVTEASREVFPVTVLTFVTPSAAQFQELTKMMTIERRSDGPIHITEGVAPAASIQLLARLGYVRWIEEQAVNQLHNLEGGMGVGGDVVRNAAIDGTDVNVMVVDTGIARDGSTYHPDLLGSRILDQWDYQNNDSSAADDHSHGTHVAGTVGGRYNSGNGNSVRSWQGMAPDVEYYIYKLCCGLNQFSSSWFQSAMQRGSSSGRTTHISQNSWGSSTGNTYNTNSEIADRAVRGEYNSNRMNVVTSSGNDNQQTAAPGTGKNVITVGLVKDGNYPAGDLTYSACSDDVWPPGERFCFSNYGPIDTDGDGRTRIKPDVMAPGIMTTSARPWYLSGSSYYGDKAGTSMAAPHVSGAIAQILDHYSAAGLWGWPEIVKALLLATTVDVGGDTDLYGRGLINPFHAMWSQGGISNALWWGNAIANTGDTIDFTFDVPSGYEELRVVLTWSDPAGSTIVNNDLDIYWVHDPNGASRGSSATHDDTVEYVTIPAGGPGGIWTVRIRAFSLSSSQRFGLAVHRVLADASLGVSASVQYIPSSAGSVHAGDFFYLHQYVSNSGLTAGGGYTRLYVPSGFTVIGARIYTADGHSHWYDDTDLYHPAGSSYWRVAVGETLAGYTRHIRWYIGADLDASEGKHNFETVVYWREGGSLLRGGATTTVVNVTSHVFLPLVLKQ